MGFLGISEGDPVVELLRNVFSANIVRVPEERIQPLSVVTIGDGKTLFRGALTPLVVTPPSFDVPQEAFLLSEMSSISGKESKHVDVDVGLKILEGFLQGFCIPPAEITNKFGNNLKVSFAFQNVTRKYIDVNYLGNLLTGRQINRKDPAAAIFFGGEGGGSNPYDFLIIDSIITSNKFTISIEQQNTNDFKLNVPAIQEIVGKLNIGVTVDTTTGYDIAFTGDKHLAFAFSCIRIFLNPDGTISSMPPAGDLPPLSLALRSPQPVTQVFYSPDRVLIGRRPVLLSWDDYEDDKLESGAAISTEN